jgi:hypothetical protein
MVETHFKFFKRQPSFLYKNEPEIIFDCPPRISSKKREIPLYLFIKDFEIYDFFAETVEIQVVCKGKIIAEHSFCDIEKYKIHEKYDLQGFRFIIPKPDLCGKNLFVYPKLKYKIDKKEKIAAVDNINTTSKLPFSVFIAEENYPNDAQKTAKFYDLHCHSSHTNDHIEFGAPVKFIADCADFCGLDGVAITDHSYDICCKPQNYLEKDENFTHWQDLLDECEQKYAIETHLGEEISVMRNGGKAVHLGALGNKNFVIGSADGARKNYNRKLEPSINEAIKSVIDDGGTVFAAHPGEIPNFFHRLFLRRDFWRFCDFKNLEISTVQAVNGNFDKTWRRARNLWIKLLLSGKKISLIAGNDSHGDFNRYRATGIPFLLVSENFERHFGKARTGIYGENLIDAIKNGQTFITSGAFVDIQIDEKSVISNTPISFAKLPKVIVKSSEEFGKIKKIWLFLGDYKLQKENCVFVNLSEEKYFYSQEISQNLLNNCDYLRVETVCENEDGTLSFAATSAVFKR